MGPRGYDAIDRAPVKVAWNLVLENTDLTSRLGRFDALGRDVDMRCNGINTPAVRVKDTVILGVRGTGDTRASHSRARCVVVQVWMRIARSATTPRVVNRGRIPHFVAIILVTNGFTARLSAGAPSALSTAFAIERMLDTMVPALLAVCPPIAEAVTYGARGARGLSRGTVSVFAGRADMAGGLGLLVLEVPLTALGAMVDLFDGAADSRGAELAGCAVVARGDGETWLVLALRTLGARNETGNIVAEASLRAIETRDLGLELLPRASDAVGAMSDGSGLLCISTESALQAVVARSLAARALPLATRAIVTHLEPPGDGRGEEATGLAIRAGNLGSCHLVLARGARSAMNGLEIGTVYAILAVFANGAIHARCLLAVLLILAVRTPAARDAECTATAALAARGATTDG